MSKVSDETQMSLPLFFHQGSTEQTPLTKQAISMRIGWLVGVIKAGIHDFDRYLLDEAQIKKIASTKNSKYALVDGVLYSVAIAKGHIAWAKKWGGQRYELEQEIERLRVMLAEYD